MPTTIRRPFSRISPLLDPAFDRMLEERGYEIQHTTEVMTMTLRSSTPMSLFLWSMNIMEGIPAAVFDLLP